MTRRWSLATSSYSSRCLRMSKLRASTLRWAVSIERVTQRCSIASPSGILGLVGQHSVDLGLGVAAQHDVGPASGHVGGDGDHVGPAGLDDDLRLARVLLGVENVVRELLLVEHRGEQFRILDRGGAHQHWLSALVAIPD